MILYNITINVDVRIVEKWLDWMKKEHIPEILATELFVNHKMFRLLNEEENGLTYACQYFANSVEMVLEFQNNHAQQLQSKMYNMFGNQVADFRTMLEEVS